MGEKSERERRGRRRMNRVREERLIEVSIGTAAADPTGMGLPGRPCLVHLESWVSSDKSPRAKRASSLLRPLIPLLD